LRLTTLYLLLHCGFFTG